MYVLKFLKLLDENQIFDFLSTNDIVFHAEEKSAKFQSMTDKKAKYSIFYLKRNSQNYSTKNIFIGFDKKTSNLILFQENHQLENYNGY